jgi:hypothetical protein
MKIEDQMKQHEMLANYWIARATTGEATSRDIKRGDGTPLTDEELIRDALRTAQRHIHLHRECAEHLIDIEERSQNQCLNPEEC